MDTSDRLYVASTGDRRILRFRVEAERLIDQETFVEVTSGGPDGFAFDDVGNLIVCCVGLNGQEQGHLEAWSPAGELLEVIRPGDHRLYTNVAIDSECTLFITDTDGEGIVACAGWIAGGMPLHPFRTT